MTQKLRIIATEVSIGLFDGGSSSTEAPSSQVCQADNQAHHRKAPSSPPIKQVISSTHAMELVRGLEVSSRCEYKISETSS